MAAPWSDAFVEQIGKRFGPKVKDDLVRHLNAGVNTLRSWPLWGPSLFLSSNIEEMFQTLKPVMAHVFKRAAEVIIMTARQGYGLDGIHVDPRGVWIESQGLRLLKDLGLAGCEGIDHRWIVHQKCPVPIRQVLLPVSEFQEDAVGAATMLFASTHHDVIVLDHPTLEHCEAIPPIHFQDITPLELQHLIDHQPLRFMRSLYAIGNAAGEGIWWGFGILAAHSRHQHIQTGNCWRGKIGQHIVCQMYRIAQRDHLLAVASLSLGSFQQMLRFNHPSISAHWADAANAAVFIDPVFHPFIAKNSQIPPHQVHVAEVPLVPAWRWFYDTQSLMDFHTVDLYEGAA